MPSHAPFTPSLLSLPGSIADSLSREEGSGSRKRSLNLPFIKPGSGGNSPRSDIGPIVDSTLLKSDTGKAPYWDTKVSGVYITIPLLSLYIYIPIYVHVYNTTNITYIYRGVSRRVSGPHQWWVESTWPQTPADRLPHKLVIMRRDYRRQHHCQVCRSSMQCVYAL